MAGLTVNKDHLMAAFDKELPEIFAQAGVNTKKPGRGGNDEFITGFNLKAFFESYNKMIADKVGTLFDGINSHIDSDYVKRKDYDKLCDQYNKETVKLNKANEDNANNLDNIAQYSRRDNIKIIGVEYNDEEDVEKIVLDIAKDAGVPLTKEDISIAHRINTKSDATSTSERNAHGQPKKIPSIVARITNRKKRNELFKARKNIQENPDAKYKDAKIYDDVTPLRSRMLFALRNKKKPGETEAKMFKFVWTREGRILVRTEEDSLRKDHYNTRTGKYTMPPPQYINKPQDLKDLGWSDKEIFDIINNIRQQ